MPHLTPHTTPHTTIVSGPPRTGKTIYAHALHARLVKEGKRVLVIDELNPARFKEHHASGKWDHIILTTNKHIDLHAADLRRRINTIVRTEQV